ncbi:hypothetical protein [Phaeobacter sp. JH20_18]|uniref:hypothetical protein n=1 Tax=Phaeobacter sp. JH20_18 TaxID=3112476 RepID=UPI003A87E300
MGTDIHKEAPNVVTETLFKSLLLSGYQAEVVCKSAARKKAAMWYGEWVIRVVNQDRSYEKMLVSARSRARQDEEIVLRTFKTINGLVSFLNPMGFTHINVPMDEGGRATHVLPEKVVAEHKSRTTDED